MSEKRMCQSYEIIDSCRVGNTEVVLGYSVNFGVQAAGARTFSRTISEF